MLTDDVRSLLEGVVADPLIDVYVRYIKMMHDKELFSSDYFIMELIATKDTYEKLSWALRLNDIISDQVDGLLIDFGVTLTDEITIPETVQFLEGFFLIEHWEDTERLLNLINDAESNTQVLSDILEDITAIPSENINLWIKSVSNDFIENIKNLHQEPVSDSLSHIPDDYENYSRVKKAFKAFLAERKEETKLDELLTIHNLRLLMPLKQLLVIYITSNCFNIDGLSPPSGLIIHAKKSIELVANDIYGLVVMSGESSDRAMSIISPVFSALALSDLIGVELMSSIKDKLMRLNNNG